MTFEGFTNDSCGFLSLFSGFVKRINNLCNGVPINDNSIPSEACELIFENISLVLVHSFL